MRMKQRLNRLMIILSVVVITGCDQSSQGASTGASGSSNDDSSGESEQPVAEVRSLTEIRESGKLVVLTRNAPTTWYINKHNNNAGPEHELVTDFADSLGVEVEYQVKNTVTAILQSLQAGEGDMAAAGLTITPERQKRFRFGPAYQDVTQQVVCRRDRVQPEEIADLVGLDITVIADSSYSAKLETLKSDQYPALDWSESDSVTTEQLLYQVWQGEIDCTIADSNIVDINRRYYPELIAPINLSREQQLGWALPKSANELEQAIKSWLDDYRDNDLLAAWHEHFYGYFEIFDYVDIRAYVRRIDKRFPRYREYFREAAEKYDLPFTLLAAQGYQESHWNPKAKSPTGVRGIMMLTQNTAKAMGVDNRLDPKQSIFGGAKYLVRMKKRFKDEVTEPDRTLLALAAYNVGRGHMHDAQVLARQKDLSPHHWRDIKQVLPLLADKRYYPKLKYGYARGTEPVRYVQRIREYRHVLEGEPAE